VILQGTEENDNLLRRVFNKLYLLINEVLRKPIEKRWIDIEYSDSDLPKKERSI
jgi:hypothetical protein